MKLKTLLIFGLLFVTVFAIDAKKKKNDSEGVAIPKFTEQVYDFGAIHESNGQVVHMFDFTNIGNGNLVIVDATAECGCTRPEYPKKPIAPGKSGKIKVIFNPAGRPGSFDKVVTVRTNGKPSKVRLKIRGTVIPKKNNSK